MALLQSLDLAFFSAFLGFTRSSDRNVAGVTVLVIFALGFIAQTLGGSQDASTHL